jgi:hypothetical protein
MSDDSDARSQWIFPKPTQQEMWDHIPEPKHLYHDDNGRYMVDYGRNNVAQGDSAFEAISVAYINTIVKEAPIVYSVPTLGPPRPAKSLSVRVNNSEYTLANQQAVVEAENELYLLRVELERVRATAIAEIEGLFLNAQHERYCPAPIMSSVKQQRERCTCIVRERFDAAIAAIGQQPLQVYTDHRRLELGISDYEPFQNALDRIQHPLRPITETEGEHEPE